MNFRKLRTGKVSLNPKITNAVVHCQVKYKLSENDTIGFCVDFTNTVFDQNGLNLKRINGNKIRRIKLKLKLKTKKIKRLKIKGTSIWRWLHSGALKSLQHIAQALLNTSSKEVTNYRFDDIKKVVGFDFRMLKLTI